MALQPRYLNIITYESVRNSTTVVVRITGEEGQSEGYLGYPDVAYYVPGVTLY
jgi:hypothetical protein